MGILPHPSIATLLDSLQLLKAQWQYAILSVIALLILSVTTSDLAAARKLPPGPPPLPFIGNKLQLTSSKPWIQFEKWSKIYGGAFTIWTGRRPTIVISDPAIAAELLEKRSSKYSSRPRCVAMGEILWDGASILVQPYGKAWSIRRKLLHQGMTPSALKLYKPCQEAEATRLCAALLETPWQYVKHFERFTSSIVFSIAYGHRIDSLNARVVREKLNAMQYAASLNVPGRYIVESFPFLKYIPSILAPWKREIQTKGRAEANQNIRLLRMVDNDIKAASATSSDVSPSLSKLLLEDFRDGDIPLSERDFSFVPASLFGAGSDTTASTLCSAFLALITHPETLRLAQSELDAVVGPLRTPSFEDEPNLPYVRALLKEVLRWRPVAVLGGTPHASTEDDIYRGWHIPAGTTILGNSWAINMNEEYYPVSQTFDPIRFLDGASPPSHLPGGERIMKRMAKLKGRPHPSPSGHSSFGWGRRICPGAQLAENSLFIALSKIIWGFDVMPVEGQHYDTFDYTDGFNIRPNPFECIIKVRSDSRKEVIKKEQQMAEQVMRKYPVFEE